MSGLLQKTWMFLKVYLVRTSISHPLMDGVVERFNQTLEGMLNKFVTEEPWKWVMLLP